MYGQGPLTYYPGRTVAPQSLATLNALNTQERRAQSPDSLTAQARDLDRHTLQGDFLYADSNPYLKGAVDRSLGDIQGRVAGIFGRGGGNNYGSSAHQEWLANNLAAQALPIYAQNYKDERQKQLFAQQQAPSLDVADINQLSAVGSVRDAYEQALINAEKQRYDFGQLAPWDALQRYGTSITGNYGSTQQQPYYPANPYMNALGMGLGAMGIYGMGQQSGLWGGGGGGSQYSPWDPGGGGSTYDPGGDYADWFGGYTGGGGAF